MKCGVVWCGVVKCGEVWYGVVKCGVVWCGEEKDMKQQQRQETEPTAYKRKLGSHLPLYLSSASIVSAFACRTECFQ